MAPQLAANSLSTPSTNAIEATATLAYTPVQTPLDALPTIYDIPHTIAHLASLDPPAKNVALQFPDELLIDSVDVFRALQDGLDQIGKGGRAWVLADTTYGSCCIDSLSALHIQADFLIHYGHACLTRCSDPSLVSRIRYVFPRLPIQIAPCVDALLSVAKEDEEQSGKGVLVMYDVGYHWALNEIRAELEKRRRVKGKGREVIFSEIELEDQDAWSKERSTDSDSGSRPTPSDNTPALALSDPLCPPSTCCSSSTTASSACCSSSTPAPSTPCCQPTASSCPPPLTLDTPLVSQTSTLSPNERSASLRSYSLPEGTRVEDYVIFYIGLGESIPMRNLLVTHSRNAVYSYTPPPPPDGSSEEEPVQTVLQSYKTSRLLMRRYALMQKARDADVFGLLVGNVNLSNSLPLLSRLRTLLKKAEKKTYTISVGKLNPAKLANFAEIECFVLVACGENSLVDSKEFYQPIITPFELDLALRSEPDWTGDYVLDFTRLLGIQPPTDLSLTADNEDGQEDEEVDNDDPLSRPVFSTITGTYRHPKRFTSSSSNTSSQTMTTRSDSTTLSVHAHVANPTEHFQNRTWVGLDPRVGLDKVSVLEEGRAGRAWGYEEEKKKEETAE